MEITKVVERPETFEAVRYTGVNDPELIEWCEGRLTAYDGKLMLHIYDNGQKRWVVVEPDSWILKKSFNTFWFMSDENYKKCFMGAPE